MAAPAETPSAAVPATAQAVDDGKVYPVTGIKIDYKNVNSEQPPLADLLNTEITLGVKDDAYVAARPGVEMVKIKLGEIGKSAPQKIYRSGIAAIYGQVVRYYNARNIIGVFGVVDAADIDANDNDIRPADRTTMQFIVVTSEVKQVRTVAIGDNTADKNRVDNPRQALIRERSPLQPATEGQETGRMDLLKKDALDEYVLRLNRQPGRRVDVAVSGTNDPGGVNLDYLISEARPWYVFGQVSNTGTAQTNEWRERFGFVDNQLTGRDDILTLDYITAGFSESQAVLASYELPFLNLDRVRYKVYTNWNEYTASDVGQNLEQFTGNQWTAGNELVANIFQRRELFVDAVGGFEFQGIETDNTTTHVDGKANYFEPYIGLNLDRSTDLATTAGTLKLIGFITNASQAEIAALGRADPTQDPVVLQYGVSQSFFLEPLIEPEQFAAGTSTLAHELYFSVHGQWAFNDRLFPNAEDIAGGLYTVRGYPESIAAGDSTAIATAEYRFHVPRVFAVQSDPTKTPFLWNKSFKYAPQQTYGHPDWDLIMRTFIDAAYVANSNKQPSEFNENMIGAGVGMELQYKQNFNVRVDWGAALRGFPGPKGWTRASTGLILHQRFSIENKQDREYAGLMTGSLRFRP